MVDWEKVDGMVKLAKRDDLCAADVEHIRRRLLRMLADGGTVVMNVKCPPQDPRVEVIERPR